MAQQQLQAELETEENRALTFQPQINEYEFKSHRSVRVWVSLA